MTSLLLTREKKVVSHLMQKYRNLWRRDPKKDKDLFMYLGDNPRNRVTWTAVSRKISTFRVGCGKHWHCASNRWLTGREKLACLGYPVTPDAAHAMGCPVLPIRCTKRASQLAGNCMHFNNVAVMQLLCLSCFQKV